MSSIGSFFSYVNDARSHKPEISTKFYGNHSSRSRDDTCGKKSRRADGQTGRYDEAKRPSPRVKAVTAG